MISLAENGVSISISLNEIKRTLRKIIKKGFGGQLWLNMLFHKTCSLISMKSYNTP